MAGWAVEQIACELGISAPTLRKHYFRSGKVNFRQARSLAVSEVRGRLMLQLDAAALGGNVGAMKALHALVERAEMEMLPKRMDAPKATLQPGKKEQIRAAANRPTDAWGDLLKDDAGQRPN